jgi:archaellum component FlaF (FlaF/FlaG flagellin family)
MISEVVHQESQRLSIQSPWVAVSNKAIELYRAYIGEFGLSPSARVRVVPGEYLSPGEAGQTVPVETLTIKFPTKHLVALRPTLSK